MFSSFCIYTALGLSHTSVWRSVFHTKGALGRPAPPNSCILILSEHVLNAKASHFCYIQVSTLVTFLLGLTMFS